MKTFNTSTIGIQLLAIVAVIFLIMSLNSCEKSSSDFIHERTERPLVGEHNIILTIKTFDSVRDVEKAKNEFLKAKNLKNQGDARGFSVWSPNNNECTIYVTYPRKIKGEVIHDWGHELVHCVYGSFHK